MPDIIYYIVLYLQRLIGLIGIRPDVKLVEAGGIEPPSEGLPPDMTTCLADVLVSLYDPPAAGSLKLSGLDLGLITPGGRIGPSH